MDAAWHSRKRCTECRAAGIIGDKYLGSDYSVEFYTHYGAGGLYLRRRDGADRVVGRQSGPAVVEAALPAVEGLYRKPTVVNNTETLANVPAILVNGPDWFKTMGTPDSPGMKIVCISGHVVNPGNYEVPLGTTYRELLDMAGGMQGRQAL